MIQSAKAAVGDRVEVQTRAGWLPATVTRVWLDTPRGGGDTLVVYAVRFDGDDSGYEMPCGNNSIRPLGTVEDDASPPTRRELSVLLAYAAALLSEEQAARALGWWPDVVGFRARRGRILAWVTPAAGPRGRTRRRAGR